MNQEDVFHELLKKIDQLESSSEKEKLLVKALVISEIAGLNYSQEIVDRLVENRKESIQAE
ncbi:hypothetical protein [Caldanaerobacter subterraneus]|uniref:Uncharacterized protein n=1 Tax=Caldanaerobacter subterraneus TaxID=911092 RepID=A0A4R2JGL1_9THEO|nr:hypothetical protein [Caldanaerobacter subterraneus]TCO57787.1 hypothetical protein EV203_12816 [Caldanaerobacter subterraneus]